MLSFYQDESGERRHRGEVDRKDQSVTVRVGRRGADDIYAMTGWTDAGGWHPGDGVPRLLNVEGVWQLWYLTDNRDGER